MKQIFSGEPNEVKIFLAEHLAKKISEVAPIGKGEWSKAFSFRAANADYIIRFGAFKEDFEKDRLAASFASADLPIPKIYEIGQAFGQHFAISERAFGEMLGELDEIRMKKIVPAVINLLDNIRRADISSSAGYGMWHPDGTAQYKSWRAFLLDVQNDELTRRTHGWSNELALFPIKEKFFHEVFDFMKTLIDECPEDRYLIHNDLLHYNVLVSGDRLSAVIDWGNSIYGDFLYELALFSFYAPWYYPSMNGIDWTVEACNHYEATGLSVPSFKERLLCYETRIALHGMAYCAFKKRWSVFDAVAKRAADLMATRNQ